MICATWMGVIMDTRQRGQGEHAQNTADLSDMGEVDAVA